MESRKLPVEILSSDDFRALYENLSYTKQVSRGRLGPDRRWQWLLLRGRALLFVLWGTGVRVSELLNLTLDDVNLAEWRIVVRQGKGGKSRVVCFDRETHDALSAWIYLRDGEDGGNALFPRCPVGGPSEEWERKEAPNGRTLHMWLSKLTKRAGITKRVHPHCFRHTHAHRMDQRRVPMSVIQKQLGHSNLSTTNTYLSHVDTDTQGEFMKHAPGVLPGAVPQPLTGTERETPSPLGFDGCADSHLCVVETYGY